MAEQESFDPEESEDFPVEDFSSRLFNTILPLESLDTVPLPLNALNPNLDTQFFLNDKLLVLPEILTQQFEPLDPSFSALFSDILSDPAVSPTLSNLVAGSEARRRRADLLQTVLENSRFANTTGVFDSVLRNSGFLAEKAEGLGIDSGILHQMVYENRRQARYERLYASAFRERFGIDVRTWTSAESVSSNVATQALDNYYLDQQSLVDDPQFNERSFIAKLDKRKNVINSPIDEVTRAIIRDKQTFAREEWLEMIEEVQVRSSAEKLKQIDAQAELGRIVQEDLVIVGGGPMTALLVRVLSPYYKITVITDKAMAGEPVLSRANYFNSPDATRDPNAWP